jgi:hypothetical protein
MDGEVQAALSRLESHAPTSPEMALTEVDFIADRMDELTPDDLAEVRKRYIQSPFHDQLENQFLAESITGKDTISGVRRSAKRAQVLGYLDRDDEGQILVPPIYDFLAGSARSFGENIEDLAQMSETSIQKREELQRAKSAFDLDAGEDTPLAPAEATPAAATAEPAPPDTIPLIDPDQPRGTAPNFAAAFERGVVAEPLASGEEEDDRQVDPPPRRLSSGFYPERLLQYTPPVRARLKMSGARHESSRVARGVDKPATLSVKRPIPEISDNPEAGEDAFQSYQQEVTEGALNLLEAMKRGELIEADVAGYLYRAGISPDFDDELSKKVRELLGDSEAEITFDKVRNRAQMIDRAFGAYKTTLTQYEGSPAYAEWRQAWDQKLANQAEPLVVPATSGGRAAEAQPAGEVTEEERIKRIQNNRGNFQQQIDTISQIKTPPGASMLRDRNRSIAEHIRSKPDMLVDIPPEKQAHFPEDQQHQLIADSVTTLLRARILPTDDQYTDLMALLNPEERVMFARAVRSELDSFKNDPNIIDINGYPTRENVYVAWSHEAGRILNGTRQPEPPRVEPNRNWSEEEEERLIRESGLDLDYQLGGLRTIKTVKKGNGMFAKTSLDVKTSTVDHIKRLLKDPNDFPLMPEADRKNPDTAEDMAHERFKKIVTYILDARYLPSDPMISRLNKLLNEGEKQLVDDLMRQKLEDYKDKLSEIPDIIGFPSAQRVYNAWNIELNVKPRLVDAGIDSKKIRELMKNRNLSEYEAVKVLQIDSRTKELMQTGLSKQEAMDQAAQEFKNNP